MVLRDFGYFALLLGVLVTVHELGHFWVAKLCNVKVLKFSIGFGPKIIGFRRGETDYQIAWIPLGGYVRMAGELPGDEPLPPEEAGRGLNAQPPWKRALIVLAGPVFNLAFPVLIYFFVFLGSHHAHSTRVGSIEPGLPAAAAGLQLGDRILSIDGEPVQTFDELRAALQTRFDKPVTLTLDRDGQTLTKTLTPERTEETNPLETVPRGMIGIGPARPPILGVPPGSPAAVVGLHTFDRVTAINGKPVKNEVELFRAVRDASGTIQVRVNRRDPEVQGVEAAESQNRPPTSVEVTMERQPGEGYAALGAERDDLYVGKVIEGSPAAQVGIQAGDRLMSIDGRPLPSLLFFELATRRLKEAPFNLAWRSGNELKEAKLAQAQVELKDEYKQKSRRLDTGIRPMQGPDRMAEAEMITLHMGPREALAESLEVVPRIIRMTATVFGRLFTGQLPLDNLGGPIMMYQVASKSAEQGIEEFLNVMAGISINLGLMNLLPIPILDGFHLLAAVWEAVRRRPIPVRAREVANMVGLAMLLLLMVLVMKNDLTR